MLTSLLITISLLVGFDQNAPIKTGRYTVTQSWSQEKDYRRPYFVRVPEASSSKQLPVVIFLHGNGGNANDSMNHFSRRYPRISSQYIIVCPDGYRRSWNIVSEQSQADDLAFVETIVSEIAKRHNVASNQFSIVGVSNGAALANQIAIESEMKQIRNLVTSVSQLNVYQHDGKNFKARGRGNQYKKVARPIKGRRLMNISGTRDRLVPYTGGASPAIPAKGGKLAFVGAEESTYLWAKHFGYTGQQLREPTRHDGELEVYRYLDGDVVHYKVVGGGHGPTGAISEAVLLDFLQGGDDFRR